MFLSYIVCQLPVSRSVSGQSVADQQSEIIRSLGALARTCVIRLSETSVHFIVPGNENKDGVQVWS